MMNGMFFPLPLFTFVDVRDALDDIKEKNFKHKKMFLVKEITKKKILKLKTINKYLALPL